MKQLFKYCVFISITLTKYGGSLKSWQQMFKYYFNKFWMIVLIAYIDIDILIFHQLSCHYK